MKAFYYVLYATWLFILIKDLRYMLRVVLKNPKDVQVAIRASWYTVVETFMTIALGYLKCFMGEDNTLLILVSIMNIISLIGDKNHIRYVEYLENEEKEKQNK